MVSGDPDWGIRRVCAFIGLSFVFATLIVACGGSVTTSSPAGLNDASVDAPDGDGADVRLEDDADAETDAASRCGSSEDCLPDEFCSSGNLCGSPFVCGGNCVARPKGCSRDCPGICGCDGKVYCNACEANRAAVDWAESSFCFADAGMPAADASTAIPCGGPLGETCPPTEYCRFPNNAPCGAGEVPGVCTLRPPGCPLNIKEACDCDGRMHANGCFAWLCGIDTSAALDCF